MKINNPNKALSKPINIYQCGAAFDKVNSLYSLTIGLNSSEQLTHDKVYLNNVMIQLAKGVVMSNNDKIRCNKLWKRYKKK
mgnify:FL=1|tara:strand:+ start:105 stop:347 length:243 start_codon:yes stop_codon:yes gene_type:complete